MDFSNFYLAPERVSCRSCVFSATFADIARIKECFIVADSLKDAIEFLYLKLPSFSSFSASDIDNYLLSVKFERRLC